jgi:anti-anti-sigma factor
MAELEHGTAAPLVVEAQDGGGGPVVKVSGDLDISSVEKLKSVVGELIRERPRALTFELSELRFMDSAGIAVLLGAVSQVETVRLRSPSPAVRRLLELTGLTGILAIES